LSVEYCRWGSRKVFETCSTETAEEAVDGEPADVAAGRVVVVDKVNER
jgi:hypothetical protein